MGRLTEEQETKVALEDRRAVLDATLQILKWLLATLFLLNGAAALATLNMHGLAPHQATIVAAIFVKGLLAALVAGVATLLSLAATYGVVTHRVREIRGRPWGHFVALGLMAVQFTSAIGALTFVSVSVDLFVSGTKGVMDAKVAQVRAELRTPTEKQP